MSRVKFALIIYAVLLFGCADTRTNGIVNGIVSAQYSAITFVSSSNKSIQCDEYMKSLLNDCVRDGWNKTGNIISGTGHDLYAIENIGVFIDGKIAGNFTDRGNLKIYEDSYLFREYSAQELYAILKYLNTKNGP